MDTLLIQLVAPMQSWGVQSLYGDRDTGLEPTKSGVVGLLCAALGRDRSADLADLAALKMGVRVDREGVPRHDFQKAEPINMYGFRRSEDKVTIGSRHYLSDAAFLVGLEGEPALLKTLQRALQRPVYHLFLGRKAFPPSKPVWLPDGLRQGNALLEALTAYPPVASGAPARRRVMLESPRGAIMMNDQPLSFAERRFAPRRVQLDYLDFPTEAACTSPN